MTFSHRITLPGLLLLFGTLISLVVVFLYNSHTTESATKAGLYYGHDKSDAKVYVFTYVEKGANGVECFEDEEAIRNSQIFSEPVKIPPSIPTKEPIKLNGKTCEERIYPALNTAMSDKEQKLVATCVSTAKTDYDAARKSWNPQKEFTRKNNYTYLNSDSIIVDIGGNNGLDVIFFLEKYSPSVYVALEPLTYLFQKLKKNLSKYTKSTKVLYNIGLGKKNELRFVNIQGYGGEASSAFHPGNSGSCALRVVNSTEFFIKMGVGCFEVDLLTINCEGCEFDLLETLLSTNIVTYFKNIQFQPHISLQGLKNVEYRYCAIQQKLRRTHKPSYMFKYVWESWTKL